ncbi:MAG TPA: hypothetical protein VJI52_05070 [Candidatus Nanoarchaeia archaeon]|nr:hypothetical protein [Candidatus Nanoarchaeia archaeon]
MSLETIAKMAGGGLMGYIAAPLIIPAGASYAYALATRAIAAITGAYVVSSIGSPQKSSHGKPAH